MRFVPSILLLAACDGIPDEVVLEGTAFAGPGASERLAGAILRSYTVEGDPFGETVADDQGRFALPAPVGDTVFVDVEASGTVRSSFTGVTGIDRELVVDDGLIYGVSQALYDEWASLFAGCPGLGQGGASFGEVRISNLADPVTGERPLVTTAVVTLEGPDDVVREACYLDDEGAAYAPDAEATGSTGRYAIFGAPPGEHLLVVAYETAQGVWFTDAYPVRVTEGGVTPMFPLLTDFEL